MDMFANIKSVEGGRPRWATRYNFYGAYLLQDSTGKQIMQANMYVTSGSTANGCCLWLDLPNGCHVYSHGKAGGYGYDRESAAFVRALVNAGVDAEELRKTGIQAGVGMSAIIPELKKLWGEDLRNFYIGE